MADNRHVQVLHQGVERWNAWRKQHPEIHPDLSGADLSDMNLNNILLDDADVSGTIIHYTQLNHATLCRADLSSVDMYQTALRKANCSDVSLKQATIMESDLAEANLQSADLSESTVGICSCVAAKLCHVHFENADWRGTDLSRADLSNASGGEASLAGTNLTQCILRNAMLTGVNFRDANLTGVHLQHAILRNANFQNAQLNGTDLSDTVLCDAKFYCTGLQNTNFAYARFGWTLLNQVDLRTAKGLETIRHIAPSELSLSTLWRSYGYLPIEFRQGVGIPEVFHDQFAMMMQSSPSQKVCYLCYCEADQDFAQKFQTDLQQQGILCWLAPIEEDIDTFWYFQPNSSPVYDKLIVVLSKRMLEHILLPSLLKQALKLEQKGERALYVLNLDELENASDEDNFTDKTDKLVASLSEDFTEWKDLYQYQRALHHFISIFNKRR